MNIVISPFSKKLRNGKENPKNYPYWKGVISLLKQKNIIQIGVEGETKLVNDFRKGLSLDQIKKLISECDFWMSVDNFLPHLAHHIPKPGVVLWGYSDPNIFGYKENLNLLKNRNYLRKDQFNIWEAIEYNEDVFMSANDVVKEVSANFIKLENKQ
jgi:ADP-heptose:LPS heptosyltransferase